MRLYTTNTSHPNTDRQKRHRNGALLLTIDDEIEDAIVAANIREQARDFGIDRVRGL
jgi:hypothetical protein